MEQLLEQIAAYRKEIESTPIGNAQELEAFRIKYLGTKGLTKSLFGEMKQVAPEKRKDFGQVLNDFKLAAETKFEAAKAAIGGDAPKAEEAIDLTLPGDAVTIGSRHPLHAPAPSLRPG